jgi:hypothetical protein
MFRLVPALIALILSASAALADPIGSYEVSGTNPGTGLKYFGAVIVQRTGDTFQVTWAYPSGQRVIGIGIGKSGYFAVSYHAGNNIGLAVYTETGDGWIGIWAPAGSPALGTESWKRSATIP